ncbi:MAG: hypothetical protein KKA73_08975 [Chloroflexi bacterium]|nr:hypothetical protein [Chloroflexota bacterium]MBU1747810.1 hypothetical protein [Chloroflexota bacterium]
MTDQHSNPTNWGAARAWIARAWHVTLSWLLHGDPVRPATREAVAVFVTAHPDYGPYFDQAYACHFADAQVQRLLHLGRRLEAEQDAGAMDSLILAYQVNQAIRRNIYVAGCGLGVAMLGWLVWTDWGGLVLFAALGLVMLLNLAEGRRWGKMHVVFPDGTQVATWEKTAAYAQQLVAAGQPNPLAQAVLRPDTPPTLGQRVVITCWGQSIVTIGYSFAVSLWDKTGYGAVLVLAGGLALVLLLNLIALWYSGKAR